MDLDLVYVESFVVLAHERHVARAAAKLHLSPSALSKRLNRLERSVGARLMDRDTSGCAELTSAGVRFLAHCEPLLRSARAARRSVQVSTAPPLVRLGMPGSPTDLFSPGVFNAVGLALSETLPASRLQLRDVPYGSAEDSLRNGWVDVLLSVGECDHPDLVVVPLAQVGRVLLLPSHHPLRESETVRVSDVADLPMVREPTAPDHFMVPWLLGDLRKPGSARTVDVPARTLNDVQQAVRCGKATTVASATLVPLVGPGVVARPIVDAPPTTFHALRRRGDDRDAVLALLQILTILAAALAANRQEPNTQTIQLTASAPSKAPWWVPWAVPGRRNKSVGG